MRLGALVQARSPRYDSSMPGGDDDDAEARRIARSHAQVRVFGPGREEEQADADALFWDRIPLDDRAEFVWNLSMEIYSLAQANRSHEPRLPRSPSRTD